MARAGKESAVVPLRRPDDETPRNELAVKQERRQKVADELETLRNERIELQRIIRGGDQAALAAERDLAVAGEDPQRARAVAEALEVVERAEARLKVVGRKIPALEEALIVLDGTITALVKQGAGGEKERLLRLLEERRPARHQALLDALGEQFLEVQTVYGPGASAEAIQLLQHGLGSQSGAAAIAQHAGRIRQRLLNGKGKS